MSRAHYKKRTAGVTLIELIVSIAIFGVVMVMAVGSLLSLSAANKKAQTVKFAMDNLDYALEGMSRTIRIGYNYHCENDITPTNIGATQDCTGGGVLLAFEAFNGSSQTTNDQIIYRINNGVLERSKDGGATFVEITSPEITLTTFNFFVTGSPTTDSLQPRVVIIARGTAGSEQRTQTSFEMQTMITQRIFDVP